MSKCNLDHSLENVILKFKTQRSYIPETIFPEIDRYMNEHPHSQEELNELFHLFKKYDLITNEEREVRNQRLTVLLNRS